MGNFSEGWRKFRKDAYRAGYEAGMQASRRGDPETSWPATIGEAWKFAVNSDFVKEAKFRDRDPWHRKVSHRRTLAFSVLVSSWLANAADGLLKIVEWILVIALFRYLASQTKHLAFEIIATALFVALVVYMARYFIPFVLFEARNRNWLSILLATAVSLVALVAAIASFVAIGELVAVVSANQNML